MSTEAAFLAKLDQWRSLDGMAWEEATSSLQVQAYSKGRLVIDIAVGDRFKFFDWASLTKIVFSTTSAMMEIESGDLRLKDRVVDWLPELAESADRNTVEALADLRVLNLLNHSAGMTWWKPFFKILDNSNARNHDEAWVILIENVFRDVRKRAKNGDLAKAQAGRAIYSDLDFFLLGEILRRSALSGFAERWSKVADRLGLEDTVFNVESKKELETGVRLGASIKKQTAPTEIDRRRSRLPLQSVVHDENTGALFGIAPHAGLFGPMKDLSRYGLSLRGLVLGKKTCLPKEGGIFTVRSLPAKKGDWGYGFMMPTKGATSCGPKFSLKSVGHTGFTGTSLWFDPKRDLLVSILANRVFPTRENTRFLQLRPAIHTMIVDAL